MKWMERATWSVALIAVGVALVSEVLEHEETCRRFIAVSKATDRAATRLDDSGTAKFYRAFTTELEHLLR